MLEKSWNTGPRSSRYPAILGLIASFSSLYFYSSFYSYSTTSSCSSESHSASSLLLAEEISTTLDHLGGCSDDLGLVPLTFRVQEFALVVGDERPFLHQHRKRFLVCFQYNEFQSNLRISCRGTFHHENSSDVWRMLILLLSFHFCCWILRRVLLLYSACSSPIDHSSRDSLDGLRRLLVFQPAGRECRLLDNKYSCVYNWFCSLDSS